jgi:hypothetical protein
MISKNESFDSFHEFARKWVTHVEDSRGCWAGGAELRTAVLKSWAMDLYDQLIVDMIARSREGGQSRVVERWTIQYFPEQSRNYITTSNSLDKRLSVLTRTVYSVARLLPVFNYRRHMPPDMASCVYCASHPAPGDASLQIPPELRKFYSFPSIPLAWVSKQQHSPTVHNNNDSSPNNYNIFSVLIKIGLNIRCSRIFDNYRVE